MSSTVSVTGSRYRAILLQDKTMLRRSKFGVLRGLPNSEASEDPGASLDNVCTSSPRSPVPCEGSWNDPVLCKAIPGQNEGQTTSRIQVLSNFESKNASAVIILPTVQSFSNRKFVNPFELLKFHLLTNKDKHKLITQKKVLQKVQAEKSNRPRVSYILESLLAKTYIRSFQALQRIFNIFHHTSTLSSCVKVRTLT